MILITMLVDMLNINNNSIHKLFMKTSTLANSICGSWILCIISNANRTISNIVSTISNDVSDVSNADCTILNVNTYISNACSSTLNAKRPKNSLCRTSELSKLW